MKNSYFMDCRTLLDWSQEQLRPLSDQSYLDSLVLLSHVLQIKKTTLLAHLENRVSETSIAQFKMLVARRIQQEPISYLTGCSEFWSRSFYVTQDCLVPRPETELLIEKILERFSCTRPLKILDLGTGSGIIAITLALASTDWQVTATDQSEKALMVAKENASRLKASVVFKQGNWLSALLPSERFDVIVSNPPYLKQGDTHLASSLRHEPIQALVGGLNGTEALIHVIQNAAHHLAPNGYLFVEHGYDQPAIVHNVLQSNGYRDIKQYRDLSGILRATCARKPPPLAKKGE